MWTHSNNGTKTKYHMQFFISALAHHGIMTAYIDHCIGDTSSVESAILAGYISNVAPAILQTFTFNENIFIVPPIQ